MASDVAVSDPRRILAELSQPRRALITKLWREAGGDPLWLAAAPGAEADGPAPLSPGQQRLWLSEQIAPGNPAYKIFVAMRLFGLLDELALQIALDALVIRHESLRLAFSIVDGHAVQEVRDVPGPVIMRIDLSDIDASELEAALGELCRKEALVPIDLVSPPLVRVHVVALGDGATAVFFAVHHIIADNHSMDLLMRDLREFYSRATKRDGSCNGESPALPPTPSATAIACALRDRFSEAERHELEEAWASRLAGCPPESTLPPDRPRQETQSFDGSRQPFEFDAEDTAEITALARENGCTPFVVFLAAVTALVHRYTGQDDIVIGTDSACRDDESVRNFVGFLANQLPIRSDLSGNPTYKSILSAVKASVADALERQDLPLQAVLEAAGHPPLLDRPPLFQVKLGFLHHPMWGLDLPGLRAEPLESGGTAKYDLEFIVWVESDVFRGFVEYASSLYYEATIKQVVERFRAVVREMVTDSDSRVLVGPVAVEVTEADIAERFSFEPRVDGS
jgi:hypothetical protein